MRLYHAILSGPGLNKHAKTSGIATHKHCRCKRAPVDELSIECQQ
ncbi:hypothetical protein [Pseudoalteromonas aurantia]|uniref:Orphan protein n=1 Tax=Pseudoalteromonas aurantia 208 TaxID=1314867 RepID=A0ABR9EJG7_9GAMM|nr:hypothetical protein [Pseudoalteromonas aurantia]MBE0370957.1 hypothetical protein [Pseudoalteromonas aurantia 208]